MIENKVAKWQKRLEDTFSGRSKIIGEALLPTIELEQKYEKHFITKFHGQDVILNSFEGFYIDTLKLVAELSQKRTLSGTLKFMAAMHVVSFRRFRSAHILFLKGYPFDAVSLLRGLFECVMELAAIGHNVVSVNDIYKALSDEDEKILSEKQKFKEIRKHSFEVQRKINNTLIGKDSGLDRETIENMETWKWLLHSSVHKSFSAIAFQCGSWLKGEDRLSLLHDVDDKQAAFYMNTSCEIAWMLLRTFPLLQADMGNFGYDWENKWKVLDDSFRERDMGLAKAIPIAVKKFVEEKLDFKKLFTCEKKNGK